MLSAEALRAFHDKLFAAYAQSWPSNAVVSRMQGIMNRMCCCFENSKKCRKAIHKATSARAYLDAVSRLFGECPLKEIPAFSPEE